MRGIGKPRILVATDRAPMSFERAAQGLRRARGSGGVVTAVRDLARVGPLTWIAPAVVEGDLLVASSQRERGLIGKGDLALRMVAMPQDLYADYRRAFADRVLWFAQHGMWDLRVDPETPERLRYLVTRAAQAASRFADAIAAELHRPGQSSTVLLHDYQLYLVPRAVRERVAGARIGHFTHIPWPALAVWREAVPDDVLARVIEGMLAADVLWSQTSASVHAFLACVDALVPGARVADGIVHHRGHRTIVRARPASIEPATLRPSRAELARLRADGRAIVARVDRADPMKNVPAGFAAFERMLERHPERVGRVRFVARVIPTRTDVPEYARELETIRATARRVNERFGEGSVELHERADRGRALAALAAADAVLVNSRADGMNLVAKEAAVVGERAVLVLSPTAGAYEELGEHALAADPRDVEATADALDRAVAMPEPERRARLLRMRERVRSWTARDWLRAQLADLEEAAPRLFAIAS